MGMTPTVIHHLNIATAANLINRTKTKQHTETHKEREEKRDKK